MTDITSPNSTSQSHEATGGGGSGSNKKSCVIKGCVGLFLLVVVGLGALLAIGVYSSAKKSGGKRTDGPLSFNFDPVSLSVLSIGSEVDPDWPAQIGNFQRKASGEPLNVGIDGSFAKVGYESSADSIGVEVSAFTYEDVSDFTRKVNLFINDTFQSEPGGMAENFTQSTSSEFPGTLYFRQDEPSAKIILKVFNSRALLLHFKLTGGRELTHDGIHKFAGPFVEAVSSPPRIRADFDSSFGDREAPGFAKGPASPEAVEWPKLGSASQPVALVEDGAGPPARITDQFGAGVSHGKYQVSGSDLTLDAVFVSRGTEESEEETFSRTLQSLAKEDGTIRHESSKGFVIGDDETFEVWTQLIEDSGTHYSLTTFRNGVLVLVLDASFSSSNQDVESLAVNVVKGLSASWFTASE